MTKRIDPDAISRIGITISWGFRSELESLFESSPFKKKKEFYETLLRKGIAQYKEGKDASSS